MYTDMDLDANEMETEIQAAFERLTEFAEHYLQAAKDIDIEKTNREIELIFNRDMLINETEAVDNCIKSLEILSKETVIAQHPWVNDEEKEIARIKKERKNDHDT